MAINHHQTQFLETVFLEKRAANVVVSSFPLECKTVMEMWFCDQCNLTFWTSAFRRSRRTLAAPAGSPRFTPKSPNSFKTPIT
jgi:hypothetical protein